MKGKTLASRQLYGAIGIVIVVALVYAARDVIQYLRFPGESAVSSQWAGSGVTVELAGDQDHGGVYFLPHRATIYDLLREAGVGNVARFRGADLAGGVHSGDRVICDTARSRVTVGDMSAPVRLALGMPIDLNKATLEDLALVPEIGRKTAAKIVRLREEKGDFSEVDVLKRIKGLGKKKYDRIKAYLSVNRPSCS
ncbi:MAG: helix-hairpin-helix domain-containing protein [Syntrophales bacterium]|nr:helix-hairpin-helix domain-containing protein [Syntrophales bacterium]